MNNNILPSYDKTKYEAHFLGQKDLPFIFHKDTIVYQSKECIPNLHLNLELLHFVEGGGSVICDGKAFAVQQGDVVVINSYAIHSVTTTDFVRYFCLIVDKSICTAHWIPAFRKASRLSNACITCSNNARAVSF